jgi:tetratricopeptide (TPR) repeat protein
MALAFLLAATPAHNSDLWLHLASGRLLTQGHFPGQIDPFSSTTGGVFWVNHAWGWDALLYGLYQLGDGRALVVAKSILAAALAALLFCFRRKGTRAGFVALAALGAVLALGPWLLLQSTLLSLFGVVLTLYLLERPALVEDSLADRARAQRWLLVPLFACWANLDAWFLLGPVLVGLYTLGELLCRVLAHGHPVRPGEFRALAFLTLAGLAAGLLTPYHYHTYAWPTPLGLSHTEQALMRDPLGQGLVVSPFAARLSAPAFVSPGGWAYCLLLAAGAVSFALAGRAVRPGRLLAWLALATLSVYQARAIPFFAVAAGPVLALNLQEWARSRRSENSHQRSSISQRLHTLGRGAGVLGGLALLVLAWPGWLQPTPYRPRGWTVEPDESLIRLARDLATRQEDPHIQHTRFALTFSPEAAHYLAWFCPAEKGFLDSRWPLFDRVADDYVRMRRCLLQEAGPALSRELGPLLDRYQVDRILLHDPDLGRTSQAFRCLLVDKEEWDLLALEGGAALFGRGGRGVSSPVGNVFDWRQATFHPEPERRAPLKAPRPPQPPRWFTPFYRALDSRSPDRAEAALELLSFDVLADRLRAEQLRQLLAQATGLVAAGPGSDPGAAMSALAVRLFFGRPGRERVPPEALLLAVRSARRAVADHPEDAGAFLLLGKAYFRLMRQTREQDWQIVLPELGLFRRAQALAALEQAALLRPDLDEAHALLVQLYSEEGQLDRTLDHLTARLRIAVTEANRRGPDADSADDRRRTLQANMETVEALVRRAEQIYDANTQGQTDPSGVLARARLAMRYGLTRRALEMLLQSRGAIFGKAGALLQLDLMLRAGRAFDVRAWLEPEHESVLGFVPYHSLQAQAAAACGDYEAADTELDRLGEQLCQVQIAPEQFVPVRSAVALRAADALLAHPDVETGPAGLACAAFWEFDQVRPVGGLAGLLRQHADFRVLRGVLALESGAVETARTHCRAALELWGDDRRAVAGEGIDFPGRPIAQDLLRDLGETEP